MLLRTASVAIAAALAGAPAAAMAADKPVAAEHQSAPSAPAAANQDETNTYAARQQHDQKTADYQGGSLVVVGISGTALVVLLLLILILA